MPAPTVSWTMVELRWNFVLLDGNYPTGSVEVQPYVPRFTLTSGSGLSVVAGKPLVAVLNQGTAAISVPTTDDPDIIPTDFVYFIRELINGYPERNYIIEAPSSFAATGINVSLYTGGF